MKRRLVIVTEIISPYRIPLFNALVQHSDVDLHVIFLAETDPSLRQWQIYKEEIRFSYEVLWSWRKRFARYNMLFNRGMARALANAAPDVILCGGYSYLAAWQALFWARAQKVPMFLWSESNAHDSRRGRAAVEAAKSTFLKKCAGFVVPGRSAFEYIRSHGFNAEDIFIAPNAVDNEFFGKFADIARQNFALRAELELPNRYFLFTGRLVKEKGVFELLSAYAALNESLRAQIGLVFVGDGAARRELELQAASISPGVVKVTGFAQREKLASYYALAEMLILPTYTDTWGLVVNEAMACGLPVVVSRAAGCSADLVRENWNGLLVSPRDVAALTASMQHLAEQPELLKVMGANSLQLISNYSPEEWAKGIVRMVEAADVYTMAEKTGSRSSPE